MRKLLFTLAAVLMLTSCIDVQDFAGYWDKGTLDPALAGTWRQMDEKQKPGSDVWRFVTVGDTYRLDKVSDTNQVNENDSLFVRSLDSGLYHFLMVKGEKEKGGMICRYAVKGDMIEQYVINEKVAINWLQQYPQVRSMFKRGGNEMNAGALIIAQMTDDAVRALSTIPDTEGYWQVAARYKKVP